MVGGGRRGVVFLGGPDRCILNRLIPWYLGPGSWQHYTVEMINILDYTTPKAYTFPEAYEIS